jgi:hypothetical protein
MRPAALQQHPPAHCLTLTGKQLLASLRAGDLPAPAPTASGHTVTTPN